MAELVAGTAPDARALTDILRTRSGQAVHWIGGDITIGLDAGAPSRTVPPQGVRQALQAAVEAWNEVAELPVHFRMVATSDPAVRVQFCRGSWKGDLDDLGKALFTADIDTGVISSAVVEINECDRSFLPPDEVQYGRFDLQAVLTHELGHLLGLAHSDDVNALMFSRGGTAGIRTPKADDRAGIALIYGTVAAGHAPPRAAAVLPVSALPAPIDRTMDISSKMPPAEVVTAMRVANSDGAAVIIYTCEPTLLPPVSPVDLGSEHKHVVRRASSGHNRGRPAQADSR